jgi:hypothetical protein
MVQFKPSPRTTRQGSEMPDILGTSSETTGKKSMMRTINHLLSSFQKIQLVIYYPKIMNHILLRNIMEI